MQMIHLGNLRLSAAFVVFAVSATVVEASTVQFTQPSYSVTPGQTFSVDLVGSSFSSGPDGAAFSLSWNPSVLAYVGTTVANPPWDTSFVNDANSATTGVIDYAFLIKSVGDAGANFPLASFTFTVLGAPGASTILTLGNDAFNTGFVAPGAVPIPVTYVNSPVQVVPIPAAVWLFGSAVAAFGAFGRRKSG